MFFLTRISRNIKYWIIDNSFPLRLFFISRIGLFLLVYLSLVMIPVDNLPELWRSHPDNLFLDGWARWDSGWYVDIGTWGYKNIPNQWGQDTAMFPLYPLLIYVCNFFTRDRYVSGILVANLSFLFALIILFHLLSKRFGRAIAERTLILMCVNPFSFYFSAAYTESLFLLTTTFSFYFCEQRKYLLGALWAALAGATRFVGILLIIPLLIFYLENNDYDWRKIKPDICFLFASTLGTFAYINFLAVRFGNPLQFWDSQKYWGGELNPIPTMINALKVFSYESILSGNFNGSHGMNAIHVLYFLFAVILVILSFKNIGMPYTALLVLSLCIASSRLYSMGRLLLVAFPLFVAAAFLLKNKFLYYSYLYLNILLLSLFSIMFSHWYWVA